MPIQLLDDSAEVEVLDSDLGVPDGDAETIYTLRVLSPQKYRAFAKAHSKKRPTGGRGMEDYLDVEAFSDAMWDYVLKDWNHGAVLWKGQPVAADDLVTLSNGKTAKAKFQIDGPRKTALLDKAGMNAVIPTAEDQVQSFRPAS
jgi:hypothetical protein